MAKRERPLTGDLKSDGSALGLKEYEKSGGYRGVRRMLRELAPKQVQQMVKDANLRGRGGAGFNAGLKWSFVPMGEEAPRPKYIVANADEMEPGTFKDRLLMEQNPHLLIEGLICGAYAIEAEMGYVFVRGEYHLPAERTRAAIAEAYAAGFLGENILGSGFSLHMAVHMSAGRYMCGEETGLINALEGKRATPRAKPPFPQTNGLWGKPTIVQNVETLCCVPGIVANGAKWFNELSLVEKDGGTKLYGASGRVKRPGLWELPMGTTAREILEEHAEGMKPGYRFRGLLPGGASTDFLVEEHLDTPMGFDAVTRAGSRLGTGTMVVLDDRACPVGMVANLEKFFARESCGWCTPCRDGLPWVQKILEGMCAGEGRLGDLLRLEQHCKWLAPGHTFCALAPGAVEPLQSALKYFGEDFARHIRDKRCPYR